MKPVVVLLSAVLFSLNAEAQILDKIENEAKNRKNRKEDEMIDKGFDAVEDLFKNDKNKEEKDDKDSGKSEDDDGKDAGNAESDKSTHSDAGEDAGKEDIQIWTERYDFIPGSEIIFYDDFEGEEISDIPVQWYYEKGMMEIVQVNGNNKVMSGDLSSHPNWEKGYSLPEKFTIEFDVYIHPDPGRNQYSYSVEFFSGDYRDEIGQLYIRPNGELSLLNIASGKVPGAGEDDFKGKWVHISLSVNGNSIKGYWDQYRLFNARFREGQKPKTFRLWNCCLPDDKPHIFLIDNVRIAEGAHPKMEEEIVHGKIVTQNILFEYNSANLLPRSYAEIKRIADLMESDQGLQFSVEGHTDSDGSETYNQELSEKRARATMEALIDMGIDKKRLEYKGMGESAPIAPNDTQEGKAMNRRVEFVLVK